MYITVLFFYKTVWIAFNIHVQENTIIKAQHHLWTIFLLSTLQHLHIALNIMQLTYIFQHAEVLVVNEMVSKAFNGSFKRPQKLHEYITVCDLENVWIVFSIVLCSFHWTKFLYDTWWLLICKQCLEFVKSC